MSIQFKSVDFEWPNGHSVFKQLNITFDSHQKYGLVGPNGMGKSTLAHLLLGTIVPTRGRITLTERISVFAQAEEPPHLTVSEYLGDFGITIRSTDRTIFQKLQGTISMEAPCVTLSGGEWTRIRLLKQLTLDIDWIILDEPTNNLDLDSRTVIRDFVRQTHLGILLISHDRALLEEVNMILELSNRGLTTYGGNWSFYKETRQSERTRLENELRRSQEEQKKSAQKRHAQLHAQETKMTRAKKKAPESGLPKWLIGARKRKAEETFGKLQVATKHKTDNTLKNTRFAFERLKIDESIYASFPETKIPHSKVVFEANTLNFSFEQTNPNLWKRPITFTMKGSQRVSISGKNGSGKTTFLNLLTGYPMSGQLTGHINFHFKNFGILDQQLACLDPTKTVFENVFASSSKSIVETRNLLAQSLFRGDRSEQKVSTLSGGEKLRAALAKLLITDPAPQVLILDEPTNNLDLMNLEFLEHALSKFEGGLIVISHDQEFLRKIRITDELKLE